MKFSMRSYYKDLDEHGQGLSCLTFRIETANQEFRDNIEAAINACLAAPAEPKAPVMGFHVAEESEDDE